MEPPVELPAVLRERDPELIRRLFPKISWVADRYFRSEVEGAEHLSDGRVLMVSTHNGGLCFPDLTCLLTAFWRRFGLETPGYGLMLTFGLRVPGLGRVARGLGAIEATGRNARTAIRAGYPLLVCPGGDLDSLKPFRDRHRVTFGDRRGFIRLAIEQQVPIVPIVSVGAHEVFCVLNDGRWVSELFGVSRLLRIKTVPLTLSFPFGLTPAGLGALPLPSKVVLRVLPRIELSEPPSAARDPVTVERCFRHVRDTMQRGLDELASRRKRILFG